MVNHPERSNIGLVLECDAQAHDAEKCRPKAQVVASHVQEGRGREQQYLAEKTCRSGALEVIQGQITLLIVVSQIHKLVIRCSEEFHGLLVWCGV
jgi:hypothetical protein